MPRCRFSVILLGALTASQPLAEPPQQPPGPDALGTDDECVAAEGDCAVSALQKRGKVIAVEREDGSVADGAEALDAWPWSSRQPKPTTWRVWRPGQVPELSLPAVRSRPKTGLGFGGGGVRAQILTMGYLRGLKRLGLLKQARFLAVNSGSAWAGSMFVFYQNHTHGGKVMVDLDAYLGLDHNQPPLTSTGLPRYLKTKPPWCPFEASFEHQEDTAPGVGKAVTDVVKGGRGETFWKDYVVHEHLNEVGISSADLMAINTRHKAKLEAELGVRAILPQPKMPYLSMGCAIIGPYSLLPLVMPDGKAPPFTRLLATPMYTGSLVNATRNFMGRAHQILTWKKSKSLNLSVGGLIETPAFGGSYVDVESSADHAQEATVDVRVQRPFGLADAATCSSYAASGEIALKRGVESVVGRTNSFIVNYWAPEKAFANENPQQTEVAIGDGGVVENFPLVELILRGARCPVMFGNFYVPLDPHYDPYSASLPTPAPVNLDSAAFFFDPGEREDLAGYNYHNNVIFRREGWPRLINAWKAMQAKGEPMIATLRHVTVENKYWGIPAGREVFVTWVYNSRSKRFMDNAFPSTSERDLFLSQWKTKFKYDFPYADTNAMTLHSLGPEDVRMMYLHATMLVYDYKKTFERSVRCGSSLREPWLVDP